LPEAQEEPERRGTFLYNVDQIIKEANKEFEDDFEFHSRKRGSIRQKTLLLQMDEGELVPLTWQISSWYQLYLSPEARGNSKTKCHTLRSLSLPSSLRRRCSSMVGRGRTLLGCKQLPSLSCCWEHSVVWAVERLQLRPTI